MKGPRLAVPMAFAALFSGGALMAEVVVGSGCGPRSVAQSRTSSTDAVVLFVGGPGDAAVWVNGKFVADLVTLRRGLALSPGIHHLEIRHDNYFTEFLEITAVASERKKVEVVMAPVLD